MRSWRTVVRSIYKSEAGRQAIETRYRRGLEQWPVPNTQLFVPTRQGDTFVIASGPSGAPPVVLFHGSGANSSTWFGDVRAWSGNHRVYAVDLIGEPGFSAPSRPPLSSDAYANWLDDVWSGLGIARASIVGVSLGGWLALDYAARKPHRVAALSLISPSGIGRQNHTLLLKAGLLLACGSWGRRRALRLVSGTDDVPREVAEFVMAIFQHFRPRMERLPLRTDAELAALAVPVQVIIGGRDALIDPHETRARLEQCVRDLHLTFLDDSGHVVSQQADAITAFLRSAAVAA